MDMCKGIRRRQCPNQPTVDMLADCAVIRVAEIVAARPTLFHMRACSDDSLGFNLPDRLPSVCYRAALSNDCMIRLRLSAASWMSA